MGAGQHAAATALLVIFSIAHALTAATPVASGGPSVRLPRSISDASDPLSPRWAPPGVVGAARRAPTRRTAATAARRTTQAHKQEQQKQRQAPKPAAAVASVDPVPGPTRMVQLAFMHRHGARTGPVVIGADLSWARCHLSDEGARMAVILGAQLRRWYPSFIDDVYNDTRFASTSTDYERTIRTGYGVISGVFPRSAAANNFSVPMLQHVPQDVDFRLGYYYSWPAAVLHSPEIGGYNLRSSPSTLEYISPAQLAEAGKQSGADAICANLTMATTCALFAEDVGTCHLSNKPNFPPAFAALLTDTTLYKAQALKNYYNYGLNMSRAYVRAVGPYAIRIVTDVLDQFDAALDSLRGEPAESTATAVPNVYHYSAHDITLVGLFVALGMLTNATTNMNVRVPTFAAIARMELYSNASVTFTYSYCDQAYGTAHTYYDDASVLLRCLTPEGTEYASRNCPLADLRRFVATTTNVSTVADSPCYADPEDVATTRCAPWRNTSTASLTDPALSAADRANVAFCLQYRASCPAQACDTSLVQEPSGVPSGVSDYDYVLDRASLRCERVFKFKAQAEAPQAWVVCLFFGIGCFTTFALIAVAVFYCALRGSRGAADKENDALIADSPAAPDTAAAGLYHDADA